MVAYLRSWEKRSDSTMSERRFSAAIFCRAAGRGRLRRLPGLGRQGLGPGGHRQSAGRVSQPRLGEGLSRPVEVRLHLHLPLRPNDTHNCLLKAYVRSGVVTRIGPTMRYGEATDLDGNRAIAPLGPALLPEGPGADPPLLRRPPREPVHGPRGLQAVVRGRLSARRGRRPARRRNTSSGPATSGSASPHDEAAKIVAAALKNIAETYSGEEGKKRLLAQHYDEATVEAHQRRRHAGAEVPRRHAAVGHDPRLRHVPHGQLDGAAWTPRSARSARTRPWAAAASTTTVGTPTCRPGHPMVTGQQTVEFDLSRRRALQDARRLGHELDHHQDARRPLADRGPAEGHAGRGHRLRVLGHRVQGRRGDRRPARHHAGLGPGAGQRDLPREALRRRLRAPVDRPADPGPHGHAASTSARQTSSAASRRS